jgi:hypothetical protein
MRASVVAWLALGLTSCGPAPKAPVRVMAVLPSSTGSYGPTEVKLETISAITNLKGTVAELIGGNVVVVDPNDPMQRISGGIDAMSDERRYDVLVRDKGLPVRGNFIDKGGVLWPADFHTWNMVSTYYNFERAYLYFLGIIAPAAGHPGEGPAELQGMRVMYWPEVRLNSPTAITDNALYLSFIKSFVVVPAKDAQRIPLAMNLGIIGHEVAHRVFNKRALGDAGIAPVLRKWTMAPFNLLKSLDEGLADFHGYGVTCLDAAGCRASFLAASLADERTVAMRDVANGQACVDEGLRAALTSFSPDDWVRSEEMYKLGNVIAATLFQAGSKAGNVALMQKVLVASYDDATSTTPGLRQLITGNENNPSAFSLESVVNTIAAHVSDPALKKHFCNEAVDRLQLGCSAFPCDKLPDCPPSSARGTTACKLLPQP